MVSEVGCYGSTEPCEYLQIDDDEHIVTDMENSWPEADNDGWADRI